MTVDRAPPAHLRIALASLHGAAATAANPVGRPRAVGQDCRVEPVEIIEDDLAAAPLAAGRRRGGLPGLPGSGHPALDRRAPPVPARARRALRRRARAAAGWPRSQPYTSGSSTRRTGELLGSTRLDRTGSTAPGTGEIGYWTAPWARGRGGGRRGRPGRWPGGRSTRSGCAGSPGGPRIGNHASRLVALRVGVQMEGILRAGVRDLAGQVRRLGGLAAGDLAPARPTARRQPGRPARRHARPALRTSAGRRRRRPSFGGGRSRAARRADRRRPGGQRPDGPIRLRRRPTPTSTRSSPPAATRSRCAGPPCRTRTQPPDAEFFIGTVHAATRGRVATAPSSPSPTPTTGTSGSIDAADLRRRPDPWRDVGYLVAPGARGRGYAPAALRALCEWGFDGARPGAGSSGGRRRQRGVPPGRGEGRLHDGGDDPRGLRHRGERRDAWVGACSPTTSPNRRWPGERPPGDRRPGRSRAARRHWSGRLSPARQGRSSTRTGCGCAPSRRPTPTTSRPAAPTR